MTNHITPYQCNWYGTMAPASVPANPWAKFDHLKGHHFLLLVPLTDKKGKPQEQCCCVLQKQCTSRAMLLI